MANFYQVGFDDAKRGRLYADSLPPSTKPQDETRATYRAGYSAARVTIG